MKAIISGPRNLPDRTDPRAPWAHMHVELDLPGVPAVGEHITLNSGSSYTVKRRMWYVEGPENEAYWGYHTDYDTAEGTYDTLYLDVLPSDYDEPFTPDKMLAEGTERGREDLAAEIENMLRLADEPGVDPASVLIIVRQMVRDEAAKARIRAELAKQHAALAERILADLQRERTEDQAGG
jgi:hypothetical protein